MILGLVCGFVASCSSAAFQKPDAAMVSSDDAQSFEVEADVSIIVTPIVDAEIDVCTATPAACPSVDATSTPNDPDAGGVTNQCPTIDTYCAQHNNPGSGAMGSTPSCAPVETWPEALAYFCGSSVGRYLNCNGLNVIVFGSVEFSTNFVYDSTTLKLVDLIGGPVYNNRLPIYSPRCIAGEVFDLDPATCESYTATAPCQ